MTEVYCRFEKSRFPASEFSELDGVRVHDDGQPPRHYVTGTVVPDVFPRFPDLGAGYTDDGSPDSND